MIYFDNAATSFPKPKEVYDFMDQFYREYGFNVGRGTYKQSRAVFDIVDDTRVLLARILNAKSSNQIIFTPSATFALNLVLQGLKLNSGDVIYFSPFEHNGTLRTLYFLRETKNIILKQMAVDPHTLEFDLQALKREFAVSRPRLLVTSHVSNVCGVIAPIEDVASIVKEYGGEIIVDAAQCAGLIPAPMDLIDYYIFAGHKSLYGPFGIAGLVMNKDFSKLKPLIFGGTGTQSESTEMPEDSPARFEAGSMNVQAIAGLNASLKWLATEKPERIFKHDKQLTNFLTERLKGFMDVKLFVPSNMDNHFNVVSAQISGFSPQEVGKILDERFDIAVRTGLHCAPLAHQLLGTEPLGTTRFSIGYFNTETEILKLEECLKNFIF